MPHPWHILAHPCTSVPHLSEIIECSMPHPQTSITSLFIRKSISIIFQFAMESVINRLINDLVESKEKIVSLQTVIDIANERIQMMNIRLKKFEDARDHRRVSSSKRRKLTTSNKNDTSPSIGNTPTNIFDASAPQYDYVEEMLKNNS